MAEHSWRTALIATIIAKLEGADPARAAYLAVWHDTQETRTGDVNHLGKKYAPAGDPQEVTADQTAGMPEVLASAIRELVAEYEAKESPEAVCARDADKLECLLQGIEYKAQGCENAQRWIDNSRGRLVTKTANRLADELLAQGSLDWLRAASGRGQGVEPRSSGHEPRDPGFGDAVGLTLPGSTSMGLRPEARVPGLWASGCEPRGSSSFFNRRGNEGGWENLPHLPTPSRPAGMTNRDSLRRSVTAAYGARTERPRRGVVAPAGV